LYSPATSTITATHDVCLAIRHGSSDDPLEQKLRSRVLPTLRPFHADVRRSQSSAVSQYARFLRREATGYFEVTFRQYQCVKPALLVPFFLPVTVSSRRKGSGGVRAIGVLAPFTNISISRQTTWQCSQSTGSNLRLTRFA
jgi:hypothetical protein